MPGDVHWRSDHDTLVAWIAYVLVVAGLFTVFLVFTTERVAANLITLGPIALAGPGVAFPVRYTVLVRRRSLADLGLTADQPLPQTPPPPRAF